MVGNGQLRPKCVRCLSCGYSSKWGEDDYYVAIGTISLPRKHLWPLWRKSLLILTQERLCKNICLLLRSDGLGMQLGGREFVPGTHKNEQPGFELQLCAKEL